MKNGGLEALMHHLMYEVDISTFDPFKQLDTEELDTQKDISFDGTEAGMVYEWLQDGTLPYDDIHTKDGSARYLIPAKKLFCCFQQYQKECGIRDVCNSPTIFGINIRKCFPPMSDIHNTKCKVEGITDRQLNAYDCWPLAVCRAFFAENIKPNVIWSDIKEWGLLYIDISKWYKGF
jgi:hypothetical protein